MNVWRKLMTALRGGVNEAGMSIVDSQALRILDQEIRDADDELKRSREALAEIMAKQKLSGERLAKLRDKAAEYERHALQLIDQGDDALATEVAEKIANLEAEIEAEHEHEQGFARSVQNLRRAITSAENNLKRLKQQADTVRATESVQRAQSAVAARHSGSNAKMHTAMESLERIKQRQAEAAARMEAAETIAEEHGDASLEDKLRAAGVMPGKHNAQSVLERLRKGRPG